MKKMDAKYTKKITKQAAETSTTSVVVASEQ